MLSLTMTANSLKNVYPIVLGDTLPSLLALVFPDMPFFSDRRNVILAFGVLCVRWMIKHKHL